MHVAKANHTYKQLARPQLPQLDAKEVIFAREIAQGSAALL
jgi:hypothetical protein